MIDFWSVLSRADEGVVQLLLGRDFIEGVQFTDPNSYTLPNLKKIILELEDPQDLLLNRSKRNAILELLREHEAAALCKLLGLNVSNPYTSLSNLRLARNSVKARDLCAFFYLSPRSNESEVELEINSHDISRCNYPLFAHQRKAVAQVSKFLGAHQNRCLLHMPTGAGKTRTAMNVICDHLRRNEGCVVLWLANTEELCTQAFEEFSKAWKHLGNRELQVINFWGPHSITTETPLQDTFVIAGFQKTYASIRRSIRSISTLNRNLELIVVDEAHIAIAETYKLVIDAMSLGKKFPPAILGLSATPGRTWNAPDEDRKLSEFFYRQKVALEIPGFNNSIDYLVENKYLAKTNYKNIKFEDDLTDADRASLQNKFEIPEHILKKLAVNNVRNLMIINLLEELANRHIRIMVFATTVQHSNLLAAFMTFRGLWAKSVTSQTSPEKRREHIEAFKSNSEEVKILCNYGVLTTGFDAPKTSCAVIARPTQSLVLYTQMVGRAIRGEAAGGNAEAEIFTVVDSSLPGFGSLAEAFTNWEDIWS